MIVIIAVAVYIIWNLKAEAQLIANVTKGHQLAAHSLVDASEGNRTFFLASGEMYSVHSTCTFHPTARMEAVTAAFDMTILSLCLKTL